MTEQILGFNGPYRFLSNFWIAPMEILQKNFRTNEHYFQACKAMTEDDFEYVRTSGSPALAKKRGREIECRPDWQTAKERVMARGLYHKFTQNPILGQKLLATGHSYLEETNTWNDTYWGVCKGKGKNRLGELLMALRNEMRMEILLYDH